MSPGASRKTARPVRDSAPDDAAVERFRSDVEVALARSLAAAERIAIAVSGGPDSMAMLALAHAAFPGQVIAATVDHGLRAEAADEAAAVAAWCGTAGIEHVTLLPAAPITGASIQAQARTARYGALLDWARRIEVAALLTAHHADDQAETFLMRAARGSGISGLAGIRPFQLWNGVVLLRPLLAWRAADLRSIAERADLPFVDDPANRDDRHDRTRFRRLLATHEWLDAPRLARSATALGEADAELRALIDMLWQERAQHDDGVLQLRVEGLPREPLRRLVRRAIKAVRENTGIDGQAWSEAANIEPLLDAMEGGRQATQAGVLASPKGKTWHFRAAPPRRSH